MPRHPTAGRDDRDSQSSNSRRLHWLMAAVFLWGAVIALGAGLFGRDPETGEAAFAPHPLRGLIVLAAVSLFVGLWWFAAARRARKLP